MAELDERLEQLADRHVLVEDSYVAQLNWAPRATIMRGWSPNTTAADLATEAGADGDHGAAQRWAFGHGLSCTPGALGALCI